MSRVGWRITGQTKEDSADEQAQIWNHNKKSGWLTHDLSHENMPANSSNSMIQAKDWEKIENRMLGFIFHETLFLIPYMHQVVALFQFNMKYTSD